MKHPFGKLIERSRSTIAVQGQISIGDSLAETAGDKAANIQISCLSQPLADPALCLAQAQIEKPQVPMRCTGSLCCIPALPAHKPDNSGNVACWGLFSVYWEVLE